MPTPTNTTSLGAVRGTRAWYFLEERNEAMLLGRVVALAGIAVAAAFVPRAASAAEHLAAVAACGVALLLQIALWAMSRRWHRRLLLAVNAAIVVDAVLILVLADLSGEAGALGLWLLPLLALAVTLGYTPWYGVKALMLGAIVLGALLLVEEDAPPLEEAAAPLVISVALVVVAGIFTSVNERALDRRAKGLRGKWEASARLTAATEIDEVPQIVRPAVESILPDWDVAVGLGGGERAVRSWRADGRVLLEVPIVAPGGERVLGRVTASRAPRRHGRTTVFRGQVDSVREVADDAAAALVRIEERDMLERMSLADALTSLGNRRAFDEALAGEMSRSERTGDPLGLVMIDVDHFKRFNDRHGHQAGDQALAAVARAIEGAARTGDRACRIGGEEFALLLPGADEAAAADVAERVRAGIAAAAGTAEPITVSLGVAAAHGGGDARDLVSAADARLYAAKEAGRNRVVTEQA